MKKRLLAGILSAVVMLTIVPGFAAIDRCEVDSAQNKVLIEGTASADERLLLTVVKKGVSEEEFFDNMAYQYQTNTDADGKFQFQFTMHGADLFEAIASTEKESYRKEFVFVGMNEIKNIVTEINKPELNKTDIIALLKANKYAAGMVIAESIQEPDYDYVADILIETRPFSTADPNEIIELFHQYLIFSYIKDGAIDTIFDYDKYLDIMTIPGTSIFTSEVFTDSHKINATQRMNGTKIKSYGEFSKRITEAMALALIQDPDGYGYVQRVCETFASDIGINVAQGSANVYKKLSGKNYQTFAELKTAFEGFVAGEENISTSSYPSGGGGGVAIGGSSSDLTDFAKPDEKDDFKEVFQDLDEYAWAEESIYALYRKGIVAGRTENTFVPAAEITRSEFVKLVVKAYNLKETLTVLPFSDVVPADWAYPYIQTAYHQGIINGVSETEFGSNMPITRQDMAVIMQRVANFPIYNVNAAECFKDDADVSEYAYEAVYALKNAQIMVGDEYGMCYPQNHATRAEAAKVIYTAIN